MLLGLDGLGSRARTFDHVEAEGRSKILWLAARTTVNYVFRPFASGICKKICLVICEAFHSGNTGKLLVYGVAFAEHLLTAVTRSNVVEKLLHKSEA